MPRDPNGNYSLPPGNPVVTDTVITSGWANDTMSDLAAEMTDSLSRSGNGGLTGPLGIVDQSGGVPGLNFASEPSSGIKREGNGDVRLQVLNTDRMRWRSGAAQIPEVQVSGVWKEVAILEANRKVMQGVGGDTTVFFYNATVPAAAGWTLFAPDANTRMLVIGGVGGNIGGVDIPTSWFATVNISGNTNLTGEHFHSMLGPNNFTTVQSGTGASVASTTHVHANLENGSHSHTFSDSDTVSFSPRYATGVLGRLDA